MQPFRRDGLVLCLGLRLTGFAVGFAERGEGKPELVDLFLLLCDQGQRAIGAREGGGVPVLSSAR